MTGDPLVLAAAAIELVTAAGIAAYWLTWFRVRHAEPWLPPGYVEHERVFVFPDTLLSLLLVTSAVLAVLDVALGRTLGLVCAGMLLFLGVIDAAYFAQHRLFARRHDGLLNTGVVGAVLIVCVVLVVAYH